MSSPECSGCGGIVPKATGTRPRRWCSEACRVKAWRERTGAVRTITTCAVSFPSCVACGVIFAARFGGERYARAACSEPCEREWNRRKAREFKASMTDEQRAKRRVSNRRSNVKRRAAKAGAVVESFDRVEIYERDGWVCGICREPVDRELAYPDLMSASLDHVVPLALGGSHTRDNVQCAHFICNATKGARPVAVSA